MKKLWAGAALLVVAAAGVGIYVYHQMAYRPGWYGAGRPDRKKVVEGNTATSLEKQVMQALKAGKTAKIPANRLAALAFALIEAQTGIPMEKIIKDSRVTVTDTAIEAEAIVDIRRLPTDRLPADVRKTLERTLMVLPSDVLSDLYVKSRLQPEIRAGVLGLGPASGVSIGGFDLPLEKLEKTFGRKAEIPLARLPFRDIELADEAIVLIPKKKG